MNARLYSVGITVRRPNEYTSLRPRVERGPGFGMLAWWIFLLSWQTETPLAPVEPDATTPEPGEDYCLHFRMEPPDTAPYLCDLPPGHDLPHRAGPYEWGCPCPPSV